VPTLRQPQSHRYRPRFGSCRPVIAGNFEGKCRQALRLPQRQFRGNLRGNLRDKLPNNFTVFTCKILDPEIKNRNVKIVSK
jgi:hypothetical protein